MNDLLDIASLRLVVDERFPGRELDRARWFPHFLPHWATLESSRAAYAVDDGLRLLISEATSPWAPSVDGGARVAHLQTGHFSGPVGSGAGQHRFLDGLAVQSEVPELALWHLTHGVLEVRARAVRHPDVMVACWPIGIERDPRDSGEICLFEIFGHEIDDAGGLVGVGVKAHHDDRLVTDFEKVRIEGDLTASHDYAVRWTPDALDFFVDGAHVKHVAQRIDYPVQMMLDMFESPRADGTRDLASLPHVFEVERVRYWR